MSFHHLKYLSFLAAFVLCGCQEELMTFLESSGYKPEISFSEALKKEYMKLSRQQDNFYNDHTDARHFLVKAYQAGSGEETNPEYPADWRIPDRKIAEMNTYRERLIFALHKGGCQIAPQLAAEAQVFYDCWVGEEDDNHIQGAQKCMDSFKTKLRKLEASIHELAPLFIVWFNMNSARLGDKADSEIRKIARAAKELSDRKISVHGFTDGLGGRKFNLRLSQARAQAVKRALTSRGIDADRIDTTVGMGEVFGTRELEPNNRRVEVQLH